MRLRVIREPSINGATLGRLYVNGVWQCWTLEDEIREVAGQPVEQWKVEGRTAIPAGRYRVVISRSDRFSREASKVAGKPIDVETPELLNVPGFAGIRMHAGNTVADTEGCPVVGKDRGPGVVRQSRVAYAALMERIAADHEDIWIGIENPQTIVEQVA